MKNLFIISICISILLSCSTNLCSNVDLSRFTLDLQSVKKSVKLGYVDTETLLALHRGLLSPKDVEEIIEFVPETLSYDNGVSQLLRTPLTISEYKDLVGELKHFVNLKTIITDPVRQEIEFIEAFFSECPLSVKEVIVVGISPKSPILNPTPRLIECAQRLSNVRKLALLNAVSNCNLDKLFSLFPYVDTLYFSELSSDFVESFHKILGNQVKRLELQNTVFRDEESYIASKFKKILSCPGLTFVDLSRNNLFLNTKIARENFRDLLSLIASPKITIDLKLNCQETRLNKQFIKILNDKLFFEDEYIILK